MFISKLDYDFIHFLQFKQRPFKAKFIPAQIYQALDNVKNNSKAFVNFCKKWKTKVVFVKTMLENEEYIPIAGEYDPDKNQITVIVYSDEFDKFQFSEHSWVSFKFIFIQVMMHEIIHFYQFSRRGGKWYNRNYLYKNHKKESINDSRNYYSSYDEIEAYAHCIFIDYKTAYEKDENLYAIMTNKKKRVVSENFMDYLKVFNYEYNNNPVLFQLEKKVLYWEQKYKKMLSKNK